MMYTLKRCALILVSMPLLLISASCSEGDRGASTTSAAGERQYTAGQASDPNKALAEKVERALRADPALRDAPDVAVESTDGQVTLGGDVPTEDQAQRALQVARGVEGVRDVQDRMVRKSEVGAPATLHQSTTTEAPLEEKLEKPKTEDRSKAEEPGPQ